MGPPQIHGEFGVVESAPAHGGGVSPIISVLIAAAGVFLGVTSSIIFVGGSLKQVEVDSHRLDHIEAHGLPQTALLTQQVQSLDARVERVVNWMKDLPKIDTEHAVALAQIKTEIADLQTVKTDVNAKLLDLLQRSARNEQLVGLLEARATRDELRLDRADADLAAGRGRPPSVGK